jgi:hypothetical protein
MVQKDKELREAVRLGIKTLIIQEVRLLRLERAFTPPLVMDEMAVHTRNEENPQLHEQ